MLQLFRDMFSFQEVRYTTVEDLAQDILLKAKEMSQKAWEKLCPDIPYPDDTLNCDQTYRHTLAQGDGHMNGFIRSPSSDRLL